MKRTAPGPTPYFSAARSSASSSSARSESPRYEFEFMRMNSRRPCPSRRKRGPRAPCGLRTSTTTASRPLAVPACSSSASCMFRSAVNRSSGMFVSSTLMSKLAQHVFGHFGQTVTRLPPPFLARRAVVERLGPRVGDGLAARVDGVVDVELGDVLLDRVGQLGRREVDGREVVGVAVDEPGGLG